MTLRKQILQGDMPPGAHLTLRPIAKSLGISVGGVSEALRALAHEGLVEMEPHYGARVRRFDAQTLYDQHVLRIAIECESARRCAERINSRQLAELRKLAKNVDRWTDVVGKVVEAREKDMEFHYQIADIAAVPSLRQALRSIHLERLMAVDNEPNGLPVPNRTHRELVEALETHDPSVAERAMREHCEYSMNLHVRTSFGEFERRGVMK